MSEESPEPRDGALNLAGHLAGFERLEEYVARHRVRLSPNSRISMYGRVLKRLEASSPLTPEDWGTLMRAVLELEELVTIIDLLGDDPLLPERLQRVVGGQLSTLLAPEKDPARDVQFELFLAASLQRAGFH